MSAHVKNKKIRNKHLELIQAEFLSVADKYVMFEYFRTGMYDKLQLSITKLKEGSTRIVDLV